jgi:hypothetical protein
MIKGLFRAVEDKRILDELRASSQFRFCIDKIRQAQAKATEELMYASPQDLPSKQGYLRALTELVNELTRTGDT